MTIINHGQLSLSVSYGLGLAYGFTRTLLCVCEVWSTFTLIFQMRKLRPRVVKRLAQGHSQGVAEVGFGSLSHQTQMVLPTSLMTI